MALVAITKLFQELNTHQVRYCHWKSNCTLDDSLRGLGDLDLLIDPKDAEQFTLILQQQRIKQLLSPAGRHYASIEDYLGFDPDTGQLFHVHAHYQLVLGEQFVKNYRLPLEQAFLDSARIDHGVKIPAPELELIVLAIRALLKYRDRDCIKDILSIRAPGLPVAMLSEFAYLLQRTSTESVRNTLQTEVGFVSPNIILELLNTVTNSPRAGLVLYRLRQALRRELSAYQRHSRWWAMRTYFGALLRKRLSFLGAYSSGKTPVTGGKVLAVIGADGAGKSTLTRELCKWLSWQLRVRRYYMGSQEPSRTTQLTYTGSRVAGKAARVWSRLTGEERTLSRALQWLSRLSHNVYLLAVGQDRYRRYVAARRAAARGEIVICDRYPLAAVHRVMTQQPMDGPRIAAESSNGMDRITRRLSEREKRIYNQIRPPDYVFILHVNPDVSMQRKSEQDRQMVEAKSRALRQMDKQGLLVTEVDADQPYEHVVLQVKTALWALL